MRFIKQIIAVTAVGLYTIPRRLSSSVVAVIGIAGVVVVLVSVLSIAEGFRAALAGGGRTDRAIVMRSGADSEMSSGLGGPDVDLIKQGAGIRRDGQRPLASGEMYVTIDLPRRSSGTSANVPLRGVDDTVLGVRGEARIVEGRMFTFGTSEVVVGRAANGQFVGIDVGDSLRSGQANWTVVGLFETGGSFAETEMWADIRVLQAAYQRGNSYQSVLVQLDSADAFKTLESDLMGNPQLSVQVKRESDFYSEQSTTVTNMIEGIGFGVAALMALGAILGAVLTMYSSVVTRTREIATLRALGFGSGAVLISVVGESLFLALVGGTIGGALAYVGFNGYQASTMNWQSFSQVAFSFAVTPALLVMGLAWALIMGFVGGIFPAIRAARLPISTALREL
jgi:putative ABC transport system permease protein